MKWHTGCVHTESFVFDIRLGAPTVLVAGFDRTGIRRKHFVLVDEAHCFTAAAPVADVVLFPSLFYGVTRRSELVHHVLIEDVKVIIVVGKHFVHPRFGIDAQSVVAISVPRLVMLVVACIRSIDKIEPAFRHTDVRICTSEHKFVSAQKSGKLSQKSAECFVDVLVLGNFEIGYFELFVVGSVVATGGFVLIARKKREYGRKQHGDNRDYRYKLDLFH